MNIKQLFVYIAKELPDYYYDGLSVGSGENIFLRKGNFTVDIRISADNFYTFMYNKNWNDEETSVHGEAYPTKEEFIAQLKKAINPIIEKEIAELNKNSLIEHLKKDALEWGNALNEAGHSFTQEWGKLFGIWPEKRMPGYVYNNCKQMIRAAILTYLDKVSR